MKQLIYAGFSMFLLAACPAFGARTNRYVATNGAHIPPFNTWERASTSINVAVAWANTNNQGDIVYVSNGTYYLPQTVFVSNTVVRGFTGDYNDVIVNGRGVVRCFHLNCHYSANPGATLSGITISNGYASGSGDDAEGGGVFIRRNGDAVGAKGLVTNCLITGCRAYFGGGVWEYGARAGRW